MHRKLNREMIDYDQSDEMNNNIGKLIPKTR